MGRNAFFHLVGETTFYLDKSRLTFQTWQKLVMNEKDTISVFVSVGVFFLSKQKGLLTPWKSYEGLFQMTFSFWKRQNNSGEPCRSFSRVSIGGFMFSIIHLWWQSKGTPPRPRLPPTALIFGQKYGKPMGFHSPLMHDFLEVNVAATKVEIPFVGWYGCTTEQIP